MQFGAQSVARNTSFSLELENNLFAPTALKHDGNLIQGDDLSLFQSLTQPIDMKSLPVVGIDIDPAFIVEGGELQTLTLTLSKPAPSGGLAVDLLIADTDPETEEDTFVSLDLAQNIDDTDIFLENGQAIGRIFITEGATQASFDFGALEDNKVEGTEGFSLTLLDRDGYTIDPANSAIFSTIIDADTLPVVGIDLSPGFIVEGGAAQSVIFNLSAPAPVGGLVVDALIIDPDNETDTVPVFEQAQNLVDSEVVMENGQMIGRFVIAEGAIQASLDFAALEDNQVEGNESFSLTLLDRDGYTIELANSTVTSTIVDADVLPQVSIDLDPKFIVEGGEAQSLILNLSAPAPTGGLVVDILSIDPDSSIDTLPIFDQVQNIDDIEFIVENDQIIGRWTIAEGATQASLDFVALEDNLVEGVESFSLTLLDREGYTIDPANSMVTTTIIDADIIANTSFQNGAVDILNSGNSAVDILAVGSGNDGFALGVDADALLGDGSLVLSEEAEFAHFVDCTLLEKIKLLGSVGANLRDSESMASDLEFMSLAVNPPADFRLVSLESAALTFI